MRRLNRVSRCSAELRGRMPRRPLSYRSAGTQSSCRGPYRRTGPLVHMLVSTNITKPARRPASCSMSGRGGGIRTHDHQSPRLVHAPSTRADKPPLPRPHARDACDPSARVRTRLWSELWSRIRCERRPSNVAGARERHTPARVAIAAVVTVPRTRSTWRREPGATWGKPPRAFEDRPSSEPPPPGMTARFGRLRRSWYSMH